MNDKQINDGGPAFPSGKSEMHGYVNILPYYEGMTLRDWFAGQALAGYSAQDRLGDTHALLIAAYAYYEQADAMIAAREKTSK